MLTTTYGKLFIVEVDNPRERIEIQFMPDKLPISRNASLAAVQVVNRNNPRQHFTGGEERIALKLDFYADDEQRTSVMQKVNWLLGLTYDDASRVKVVWGSLFKKHLWRVDSVRPVLDHFWPEQGMLPGQAIVDVGFVLDTYRDLRRADIRNS